MTSNLMETMKRLRQASEKFDQLLRKDFLGASNAGGDRLMAQVRVELHDQLDLILDATNESSKAFEELKKQG